MLLVGLAMMQAQAQNLEAGKTPSQIFASTCAACHKSPRGLLKGVTAGSLPGFLRQHYTTSSDMASALSAYVVSNGAADARMGGGLTKQGRESMSEPKPGVAPQAETQAPRRPRRGAPDVAKPADGEQPASIAAEPRAKQKLGRKGRPGRDEPPKTDTARDTIKDEPKGESAKTDSPKADSPKADSPRKDDTAKPDGTPAADDAGSTTSKPGGEPATRADPVPAVTPAPKPAEGESRPAANVEAAPKPSSEPSPPPAPAVSAPAPASLPAETAAPAPPPPAPPLRPAPSAPASSAPVAPSGPPAPPISQ